MHARSKAEMMKQKEQILQKIMGMWRNQRTAGPDAPVEGRSG
jgi:hypothetical protein